MKEMQINRLGDIYSILVDDEDYPVLSRHKWYILPSGKRVYAYAHIGVDNKHHKMIPMTQMIMGSALCVDHIDGNPLNNQKINLRAATKQQNNWNTPKILTRKGKPTSSKYKGVFYIAKEGFWKAQIKHDGKLHNLGRHKKEEDAARAYNEAASRLHGEWAWLNTVPDESS